MDRRTATRNIGILFFSPIAATGNPASAAAPFIGVVNFVISFVIQRYSVGRAMAWLIRTMPTFFASKERRYLLAALMTLGIDSAVAAVVAEAAEVAGAENVARNGHEMTTELKIENRSDSPLELPNIRLVLADAKTRLIEAESSATWGIVVAPRSTAYRKIVATNFPKAGAKKWHFMTPEGSIQESGVFWVV